MDGLSLTIFNYTPVSERVATQKIPSLPGPHSASKTTDTLARTLVSSSARVDGWNTISTLSYNTPVTFDVSRCLHYKETAPTRGSLGANQATGKDTCASTIKEWGAPLTPDEIVDLDALEDFVSTDLSRASPSRSLKQGIASDKNGKRKADADLIPIIRLRPGTHCSSYKRIRSEFSLSPNQYIFYPCPLASKPLDMTLLQSKVPPFKKSAPAYLFPRSEDDVKKYLEEPFATTAWLIPIRGNLPWLGASTASIVEVEELRERNHPITWTRTGLKRFWEFLIQIRGQQSVGTLSLSLHIAPVISENGESEPISGLLDQDHIKVRHDASLAFTVRTLLDAWKYEATTADSCAGQSPKPRKIRPLRGAKLVLLDDCSEGLMVL